MKHYELEKDGIKNVLRTDSNKADAMVRVLQNDGFRVTPISQDRAEKMILEIECDGGAHQ